MTNENGIEAPTDQQHHHDGGELHDAQRFVARLGNALDVLPPEIDGDENGEKCSRGTVVQDERDMRVGQQFIDHAGEILARGDAADGPCENVIEHQRRNRELREGAAEGFLNHAVNAATHEHAAALDVNRAHAIAENHHGQDEPRGGLADEALRLAAGVICGRSEIVEHNRGRAPEGNEGEHGRGGHDDARDVDCAGGTRCRFAGGGSHSAVD